MFGPPSAKRVGAPAASGKDAFVKLRVVGALSGDTVLDGVEACIDWTVRRLKLAIGRREGSGALLSLLYDDAILEDSTVLSSFLGTGQALAECMHTMLLVKMPRPTEPVPCPLDRRTDRVVVQPEGSCVSSLHWRLSKRQLGSSAKMILAPTVTLRIEDRGLEVPFKLVAVAARDASFQKSRGRGHVQLKCIGELPPELADVELRLALGRPGLAAQAGAEDDVCRHNFAATCSARLPKMGDINFLEGLDAESGFCHISVELVIRRSVAN